MRFAAALALTCWRRAQMYDVVLRGGRVINSESGLDGVRNIGITGKKISSLSEQVAGQG
jgi:predicted amidohydrolase